MVLIKKTKKEIDTKDEITPLIETAHIDQVKGMRVRVFSGHGTPKFHVKKPEDFEVRIKTPRKLPKSINDLKILDYEFKKRAIRTDEMQSLIEWLGMPDKRLGMRNKRLAEINNLGIIQFTWAILKRRKLEVIRISWRIFKRSKREAIQFFWRGLKGSRKLNKEDAEPPQEMAHIGRVSGMEVKVFSGYESPAFCVIKPDAFEAKIEKPKSIPTPVDQLNILGYKNHKRDMRTDEMQSLIEWLDLPSKAESILDNLGVIYIQWIALNN